MIKNLRTRERSFLRELGPSSNLVVRLAAAAV